MQTGGEAVYHRPISIGHSRGYGGARPVRPRNGLAKESEEIVARNGITKDLRLSAVSRNHFAVDNRDERGWIVLGGREQLFDLRNVEHGRRRRWVAAADVVKLAGDE